VRAAIVPDWLAELMRPKPAPLPWPDMIRAALAICLPLAVGFAAGKPTIGLLPAMGGLLGTMTDRGGAYLDRVKRVGMTGVFGGAVGLAIGSAIHGRAWIAVIALIVVAGASALLSSLGDIGSQAGLQLLVYTSLGIGPVGALRPVWHTASGFLIGVVWALVLIVPGWMMSPHGQEQRAVAAVYQAVADQLAAIGTDGLTARREAVTSATGAAYDALLSARQIAPGRNRAVMRLVAVLNAGNLLSQAATTLGVAGDRPPPPVIDTVVRLADSITSGSRGWWRSACSNRHGGAAGGLDHGRVAAARDPARLGRQPGGAGAARRDGRRVEGAVPGLDVPGSAARGVGRGGFWGLRGF
jgi:hypothetical protein